MDENKEFTQRFGEKVNKVKLDELDLRLVDELHANCKQTWRVLAKKLGVSPVTIMNRVKSLEEKGIITGYSALIDHVKLGYDFSAFQTLQIESSEFYDILEDLQKMPEVEAVYAVSGDFDAIVFFRALNRHEFARVVQQIYRRKGIKQSKTFFAYALKEYDRATPVSQWF